MGWLKDLYRPSLGLLTDLYQVTMAYGFWKQGDAERQAIYNLYFRSPPFNGGYVALCGIDTAAEYLQQFSFDRPDLDYLATLEGNNGAPLFEEAFLRYLETLRFSCDVDAVQEGRAVFPPEPVLQVRGPILQAQLIETPLLNLINFQSLIATKAARIVSACGADPVIEFGLRRAQGIDGGLSASRAAYIGGCTATSNLLAGRLLGIPTRGTHAHSWVMFYESEPDAFRRYAESLPNNCIFLVDTYDSLEGIDNAIRVGKTLREVGHRLVGIRLDSGDLAYLSIEARKRLDRAGFSDTAILASNDLDERLIASLKQQGAEIGVWGVGTRLVTGYDQPALGGVYKLSAIQDREGAWQDRLKLSEQTIKVSYPGLLRVRRYRTPDRRLAGDVIYDARHGVSEPARWIDPLDPTRRKSVDAQSTYEELLQPLFKTGQRVAPEESLDAARDRLAEDLADLHPGIRRFDNPHVYPVGLSPELHDLRTRLIVRARGIEEAT